MDRFAQIADKVVASQGQEKLSSFGLNVGDVLYSFVRGVVKFYEVVQNLDYTAVIRQIENKLFGKMVSPMSGHYISGPITVPVTARNEVRISFHEYAMLWDGHSVIASGRTQVNTREASIADRVAGFAMSRDFYIPKNAPNLEEFKHPEVDLVFYTYGDDMTGLHGLAFQGKANKPLWHYRFRNVQQRDSKIEEAVSNRKSHHETIDQRRKERSEYKHGLQEGDILYESYGYDQTNVNYYQIIEAGDRSVKIRSIGSKVVKEEAGADYVVAVPNSFSGPAMTKLVGIGDSVKMTSYSYARKWDGKPQYQTALGWGH